MALIRLLHHDPLATGGPLTADVPEEALDVWFECGWRRAPEPEPKAEPEAQEAAPEQNAEPEQKAEPSTKKAGRKAGR